MSNIEPQHDNDRMNAIVNGNEIIKGNGDRHYF